MTIGRQYQTPYEQDADLRRDPDVDAPDLEADPLDLETRDVEARDVETRDVDALDVEALDAETPDAEALDTGSAATAFEVDANRDAPGLETATGTHALSTEWQSLQGRFVDDPDAAVAEAAALVDEEIARLLESLRQSTSATVDDTTTEQKRVAFQRYRAVYEVLSRT
jgi:hypothetical protein